MALDVDIIDGPLPAGRPLACDGAGAVLLFEGIVRPSEDGQPIAGLRYEAYEPMAQSILTQLSQEMLQKHELLAIRVEHSRGHVPTGQCSFRLQIVSRHRKEGIAAMDEFIDRLKQDVPIWKTPVPVPKSAASVLTGGLPCAMRDGDSAGGDTGGTAVHGRPGMTSGTEMLTPREAVALMLDRISPLGQEDFDWNRSTNRVLSQPVSSDRDSPPADVSAMDGYAIRMRDVGGGRIDVAGEILPGQPALQLPAGKAMRIVTGALVPVGAEAVIRREDAASEKEDHIELAPGFVPRAGDNIRRRGENAPAGTHVLPSGTLLGPAAISAMAAFGASRLRVHRRVRLGILVTGSELQPVESSPQPWEIRDSNGPQLAALAAACPWIELVRRQNAIDIEAQLKEQLAALLQECDAILLTGGVSMGSHDFVPSVLRSLGATTLFHRLPIRPGKPILGAINSTGQPILALPGNPVSVLTTACRFAGPVLRKLAGMRYPLPHRPMVMLDKSPSPLALWRFPAIAITEGGRAGLMPNRGSGDIVGISQSEGFVEIPPDTASQGPFTLWRWEW